MTKFSKYLPAFVYGSVDGLVTTFAIVMGAVGAGLSVGIILILGFASVLADAFSMGSSGYLSAKTEERVHGEGNVTPLSEAITTFISFVIIGSVPLIPFMMAGANGIPVAEVLPYAIGLTMVAFFIVGYISGNVAHSRVPVRTALLTTLIGAIAALIAYGVSYYLSLLV